MKTRLLPRIASRSRARSGEDGFVLLESMIAISLITVILAALGGFTLRTVQATSDLRARQTATQVATTAMASLGALPPTDLVTGRDPTSVNNQFRDAPLTVAPSISSTQMTPATDTSPTVQPGAGATAAVPTSPVVQRINNVAFSVNTYLGTCVILQAASDCTTAGSDGISYLRAVVAVTWSGRGCSSGGCVYVTSTLINTDSDPVFSTNKAVQPAEPVVADPGSQVTTVGATVSLQLDVAENSGAPPHTWAVTAGALPSGMNLSADGLVSGTPTAVQAATALTVTVTDAYGRTGSRSFTYRVLPPPTVTSPDAQFTVRGTAVSLAVASTCPNSPCAFTLAGAPAGLSINASSGTITGTPTTVGTSPSVTVTITDAAGVAVAAAPFSWTVTTAPTVSGPGASSYTVGTTVKIPISYTCPVATCTITLTDAIPGLTLANDPPGTSALQVATAGPVNTNGMTNLALGDPTTQSSTAFNGGAGRAVDGNTDGVYNNGSTTHTDNYQAQPWWQVDLGATSLVRAVRLWNRTDCCDTRLSNFYVFTSPTNMQSKTLAQLLADPTVTMQRVTGGLGGVPTTTLPAQSSARFVRVQLAGTEYLSLAEVQVLGTPDPGTSITVGASSGTVYATGVIPASAVPTGTSRAYTPSLTVTDATGTTDTSTAGPWTVFTAPTIGTLGTQTFRTGTTPTTPLAYTCPNVSCTIELTGSVPGLGLSTTSSGSTANATTRLTVGNASGTVYVNGRVDNLAAPANGSKAYTPTATITDNGGATATGTGNWTVISAPSLVNPGTQAIEPSQTMTLQMSASCPSGGCASWTAAVQLQGSSTWNNVTISSTGRISYSTATSGTYTMRVTVTDGVGGTDTVIFTVNVRTFTLAVPNQTTTKPSSGTRTVTVDVASLVVPQGGAYLYTLNGAPSWLSIDRNTGLMTATITSSSVTDTSISVTVTSAVSSTSNVTSAAFRWTVS